MGALPSQKYEEVCEELLKYVWDEYRVGIKGNNTRHMVVLEFLKKCNDGEIDVR